MMFLSMFIRTGNRHQPNDREFENSWPKKSLIAFIGHMLPVNVRDHKSHSGSHSRSSNGRNRSEDESDDVDQLKMERDDAFRKCKEWQVEVASLKAELDKERGAQSVSVDQKVRERERDIRAELNSEWAKSEAGWKERIRNERLLRLSYERVLLGMGFTPSRIASDIVRVSRPQPLHEDPGEYKTLNLLDLEAGLASQPSSKRKGLFAYSINDIKASMNLPNPEPWDREPLEKPEAVGDDYFPVNGSVGKRDLLKILSADEP